MKISIRQKEVVYNVIAFIGGTSILILLYWLIWTFIFR